ncbi:MAG: hypothetical protein ABSH20_12440 [Tepidisphaeraceae bacterium]
MPFELLWTESATRTFNTLQRAAETSLRNRQSHKKSKATRDEGLFKQVVKCVQLLSADPRHPGLQAHEFTSIENPFRKGDKVCEAYVQNRTPGAYRLFWCYGPEQGQITVFAITPHP